jgi:hypothetical protein
MNKPETEANDCKRQPGLAPATLLACDGRCGQFGECEGEIQRVTVRGINGRSWGKYNYCAKARKIDEANGYDVEQAG